MPEDFLGMFVSLKVIFIKSIDVCEGKIINHNFIRKENNFLTQAAVSDQISGRDY